MAKYIVEMQMDKQEKFYFIRENESGNIVYLPSKYLMHKKRSKISPNTIQRSAFALSYYLNFLDEKQLCLDDIYQMKYIEQHEHFTDFLIWLKAGMHSREDYLKLPNNETCNAYLKEVFRFYTFMEQENKHSESLKVLSDTQMIVRNSIGIRKVLNRKSFRGYLKENRYFIRIDQVKSVTYEKAISEEVAQLIMKAIDYTKERYGETTYIFAKKDDPTRPYQYSMIQNQIMTMIRQEDIRDDNGEFLKFGTHIFRHCYGKKLTEMHVDDWMIAKLLGHTSIYSVHHYRKIGNKLMADETRAAREKMDMILLDIIEGWDDYEI